MLRGSRVVKCGVITRVTRIATTILGGLYNPTYNYPRTRFLDVTTNSQPQVRLGGTVQGVRACLCAFY